MPDQSVLRAFLDAASVDGSIFTLRPDYRALLVAVDGIAPAPSDAASDALLQAAETAAAAALEQQRVEEVEHIAAWRDAYRSFGAKPQRTRTSVEALLRRAAGPGMPRVNRLTDVYNAVSVLHQLPLGGEDLSRYAGSPRLIRAAGSEPFDTTADGASVVDYPEPGEVVWCDDEGVTCRRWNWRQATRTQLHADTTTALFIFDALDPMTTGDLDSAADDLLTHLRRPGDHVTIATRHLCSTAEDAERN